MIRLRPGAVAAAGFLAIAIAAGACGGSTGSPSAGAPGSGQSPGASGPPASPEPSWPPQAARAMIALGAADNEIGEASADLQRAIAEQDLALMRRAADGLTGLTILDERVGQIEGFQPTEAIAARYRDVLPRLVAAATKLRDAIDAGDASGIEQGNIELARALADYVAMRPEISTLAADALEHQRRLLR